jgi:hypothetical protein
MGATENVRYAGLSDGQVLAPNRKTETEQASWYTRTQLLEHTIP